MVKLQCIKLVAEACVEVCDILWLNTDSVKWETVACVVRQRRSRGRKHSRRIHAHSWHFPQTSAHSVGYVVDLVLLVPYCSPRIYKVETYCKMPSTLYLGGVKCRQWLMQVSVGVRRRSSGWEFVTLAICSQLFLVGATRNYISGFRRNWVKWRWA